MKKQTNHCLNFIKAIACFGILYMHTNYGGMHSSIICCLVRFAVPIFFMISGYYCFNQDRDVMNGKMPKKVIHILKLAVFVWVLYFIWSAIFSKIITGEVIDVIKYSKDLFTLKHLWRFLLLNQTATQGIMWFVFALLYCYLLFWLVNKFNLYKLAYVISAVLIVAHIVVRGLILYSHPEITANPELEQENVEFFRNFLMMGFPFFMVGNFIHRYEDVIKPKFSNIALLIMIPIGLVISCVERRIVPLELFWGTLLVIFAMFILAIKNPEKKVIPIISKIGAVCATAVYIAHPIVNVIVETIYKKVGIENNKIVQICNPLIVYIIIVICALLVDYLKNKVKKAN